MSRQILTVLDPISSALIISSEEYAFLLCLIVYRQVFSFRIDLVILVTILECYCEWPRLLADSEKGHLKRIECHDELIKCSLPRET